MVPHALRGGGRHRGAVVSHTDITERKIAELNLRELTMIDPMTGVLNRRGFAEALAGESDRARRHASPLAAILIDCDHFKAVNERFGHAVGDQALANLSRRLAEVLRPSDRIARAGGDEFLVLLPDTRGVEAALVADRLRVAASSEQVLAEGIAVHLTVSLAVTPVDVDNAGIEDILKDARAALTESKTRGKNRTTLAAGAADAPAARVGDIAAVLRATDGIRVARQPIRHLADGSLVGHEFLSRGPAGPLEMPKDLFRRAGEDGLLSALDLRCLRACINAAADRPGWRHANLYPSTLIETPADELLRLFPDRAPDETYCIELSEQQLLGATSALREATGALRRSGLRFAIDDVGFGRTSLEHLVLIEPEVVRDRPQVGGRHRPRSRSPAHAQAPRRGRHCARGARHCRGDRGCRRGVRAARSRGAVRAGLPAGEADGRAAAGVGA